MTRRSPSSALPIGLLVLGGCAQRGAMSGPPTTPGAGTWVAVWAAVAAAVAAGAALVLLPGRRRRGSTMASVLLAAEAATALVGGAVLVGAAVRSAQLVSGPPRSGPAPMLLRLSGFDGGDAGFFRLMGGFVAVVAGALVVVLAMAARGADGDDPFDRALATCVLVAEAALCVAGIAMTILEWGQPRLLTVVSAVAFPVVVAAAMAAWPRGVDPDADGSGVGYNDGHG